MWKKEIRKLELYFSGCSALLLFWQQICLHFSPGQWRLFQYPLSFWYICMKKVLKCSNIMHREDKVWVPLRIKGKVRQWRSYFVYLLVFLICYWTSATTMYMHPGGHVIKSRISDNDLYVLRETMAPLKFWCLPWRHHLYCFSLEQCIGNCLHYLSVRNCISLLCLIQADIFILHIVKDDNVRTGWEMMKSTQLLERAFCQHLSWWKHDVNHQEIIWAWIGLGMIS